MDGTDHCKMSTLGSATAVARCATSVANVTFARISLFMSANLTSVVLPAVLLLMMMKLWRMYCNTKDPNCSLPLPPGTMGLPIIGETLNLIFKGSDFFGDRSKNYGNVYKTHILGNRTIRVTGAKNVAKILQGEGTLVTSQWPPSTKLILGEGALAHSKGDEHKWRREAIMKAFTPEAMATYVPSVQAIVHDYVKKWCGQGHIHGYPEARSLTFTIAAKLLLGFDIEERKKFKMLILFEDMLTTLFSMPIPIPGIGLYRGLKARKQIMEEIMNCIQTRQISNGNDKTGKEHKDALGLILQADRDGEVKLSNKDVQDWALEMLFAGHLPTSSAASSVLMLLGSHPKVVDKITVELFDAGLLDNSCDDDLTPAKLAHLPYIDCVIKEILRVAPPVGAGYREALETFELDGCQVPKGWTVIYSIRETQHSDALFTNGKNFDPERWREGGPLSRDAKKTVSKAEGEFGFVPFGYGDRACVGQKYAQAILKILIIELVRNSSWKLENGMPKINYMPVPHPVDNMPLSFKECPPEMRRRAFTMSW